MKIEVLGSGCSRCIQLYESVKNAVERESIEAEVIKEERLEKILEYGVISTPALVVDGTVVSTGKLLKADEAAELLREKTQ